MKLLDSHAHFDLKGMGRRDVEAMLDRAWDQGLVGIIAIAGATRVGEWEPTFEIALNYHQIWTAAGIHPHTASDASHSALDKLRHALDNERVVAIGETGLDYHYNHSPPADQRRAFAAQVRMAHQVQLPIIVHTREADYDTLAILRDEGASEVGGVIHCFSSTLDLARRSIDLGFFISFSGIVTFPAAEEVARAAQELPADKILAETDTPFLSPVPYRGRPNEPARVLHVVEKLASLRQIETEEMATITVRNARRLFNLPAPEGDER